MSTTPVTMIHIQRFGIEIWINLQKQTNILMRRAILTLNSSENISKILWNSLHILASWCLNDFFIEFKSLNLNFCYWVEPRTLMLIEVHFALKGHYPQYTYPLNCDLNLGPQITMKPQFTCLLEDIICVYDWWPQFTYVCSSH